MSACWPRDERFGLTAQIRRSVVSVGANIAEGSGRGTPGEYAQFLSYAIGSLNEVHHHLTIAVDVGIASSTDPPVKAVSGELNRIGKMLHGLRAAKLDQSTTT